MRGLGPFRGLGFRGFRFRDLGFRGLGFRGLGILTLVSPEFQEQSLRFAEICSCCSRGLQVQYNMVHGRPQVGAPGFRGLGVEGFRV